MASDIDIAWAAGLFEGEGCFSVSRSKGPDGRRREQPTMAITMSDRDVLERFQAIAGVGALAGPLKRDQRFAAHKPLYKWQIQRRAEIERLGELLGPHLGERRTARLAEVLSARQKNESRICSYCGKGFVPLRLRTSENVFCTKICNTRYHLGIKVPRYGNPPATRKV